MCRLNERMFVVFDVGTCVILGYDVSWKALKYLVKIAYIALRGVWYFIIYCQLKVGNNKNRTWL